MTVTIDIPEEEAIALQERAREHGITFEEYARQMLRRDLVPVWLRTAWDSAGQNGVDALSAEEIDSEIAAARAARSG